MTVKVMRVAWPFRFAKARRPECMSKKTSRQKWHKKRNERDAPERKRGQQEAGEAIAKLQTLWPDAFPKETQLTKPLAVVPSQVAAETGWSRAYAQAVLRVWKAQDSYQEAVLQCERYYDLNGEPTECLIEAEAKARAQRALAQLSQLAL
jgi:hypothetical protein